MKTLTSLYIAILNNLDSLFSAHATAFSCASASAFSINFHTDQSNRSNEIQRFSVNTAKTGDRENNGDKI